MWFTGDIYAIISSIELTFSYNSQNLQNYKPISQIEEWELPIFHGRKPTVVSTFTLSNCYIFREETQALHT